MTGAIPNLTLLRCAVCGQIEGLARAVCAACLSDQLGAVVVPSAGRIVSFTTIRRAPARFRDEAPYLVIVVDLDAGPRVTGRLAPESASPEIGAAVRAISAGPDDLIFTVQEPS